MPQLRNDHFVGLFCSRTIRRKHGDKLRGFFTCVASPFRRYQQCFLPATRQSDQSQVNPHQHHRCNLDFCNRDYELALATHHLASAPPNDSLSCTPRYEPALLLSKSLPQSKSQCLNANDMAPPQRPPQQRRRWRGFADNQKQSNTRNAITFSSNRGGSATLKLRTENAMDGFFFAKRKMAHAFLQSNPTAMWNCSHFCTCHCNFTCDCERWLHGISNSYARRWRRHDSR